MKIELRKTERRDSLEGVFLGWIGSCILYYLCLCLCSCLCLCLCFVLVRGHLPTYLTLLILPTLLTSLHHSLTSSLYFSNSPTPQKIRIDTYMHIYIYSFILNVNLHLQLLPLPLCFSFFSFQTETYATKQVTTQQAGFDTAIVVRSLFVVWTN